MFWVGSDPKDHLVPTPMPRAGTSSSLAQSFIQPGLEHFQQWGIPNFFGQPVPVSHHSHSEFFPISNLNLFSFSLKPEDLKRHESGIKSLLYSVMTFGYFPLQYSTGNYTANVIIG